MYRSSAQFRRTPAERAEQLLSWNRDDVRFFAAGACHILAFAFLETYPEAGFRIAGVWARGAAHPTHVYVTDGEWALDFDGWTPVDELLAVTRAAEPDAGYRQGSIEADLSTFCGEHDHRDRQYFAFDPWGRALRYLARFPTPEEHRAEGRHAGDHRADGRDTNGHVTDGRDTDGRHAEG
jgi:hypothetical protein